MIVGAWFTSNVQPPPKPTDESASVSEQIEALYDGQAENVEVALKEVPTEDEGSRWGYSSSWQLGTSPVKVVTWLDTADVEGHAANHPSFPQSSGPTPKTYVAVARAVEHALLAPRPKTRYLVGTDAKIRALMAKVLPDRLADRLLTRIIRLPH